MCPATPLFTNEMEPQGLCELSMPGLIGAATVVKFRSFVSLSPKFNIFKSSNVVILKFISLW